MGRRPFEPAQRLCFGGRSSRRGCSTHVAVALVSPALVPGKALSVSDQLPLMEPWRSANPPGFERAAPCIGELDASVHLQPLLQHAVDRLPDPPLWNPHIMSGRPLLANSQSAIFSPFSLPVYLLPNLTALGLDCRPQAVGCRAGTFGLGRVLGMRMSGRSSQDCCTGSPYGLSPLSPFRIRASGCSSLGCYWRRRLVRRPDILSGVALATVTAVQFLAGHPESSSQAVALTVLFFSMQLLLSRRAGAEATQRLTRPLLVFCVALVGGGLVAALVIFPFVELLFSRRIWRTERSGN